MFEFIQFSPKKLKIERRSLLNVLEFANEKEKLLVEYTIKSAINQSTNLYALKSKKYLGLLGLSASTIQIDKNFFPAINIDLLFVSLPYRKKVMIENKRVSYLLLEFAIFQSKEVKKIVGVRFLSLYPLNKEEKLINFYNRVGFFSLKSGFMVMKI